MVTDYRYIAPNTYILYTIISLLLSVLDSPVIYCHIAITECIELTSLPVIISLLSLSHITLKTFIFSQYKRRAITVVLSIYRKL